MMRTFYFSSVYLLLLFLVSNTANAFEFPAGTVWFNTDYAINAKMCTNKLLILNCIKAEEITGWGAAIEIQEELVGVPQSQVITVIEARQPAFSRSEVLDLIRQFNLNHPVAIVPSWDGIPVSVFEQLPQILVFNKDMAAPALIKNKELWDLNDLFATCKSWLKENASSYALWQALVSPEVKDWAQPLIALPTDLFLDEGELFVSEPRKFRVTGFNENKEITHVIGGARGKQDGDYAAAQFKFPAGMAASPAENAFYVADVFNHCVRLIAPDQKMVFTFLGNGKMNDFTKFRYAAIKDWEGAIPYPIDVQLVKGEIFVLSALDCSIWKVSSDGKSKLIWKYIPSQLPGGVHAYAREMIFHEKGWYMLLSNGYIIRRKGKKEDIVYEPKLPQDKAGGFAFYNNELVVSLPYKNQIVWKSSTPIVAGDGLADLKDGHADTARFVRPQTLTKIGSEIFISSGGYHGVRKWKMMQNEVKTMGLIPTEDVLFSGVSPNAGEALPLAMIQVEAGLNELTVEFDTPGFYTENKEQNLLYFDENSGANCEQNVLIDGSVKLQLQVKPQAPGQEQQSGNFIQFGAQLLLHPDGHPEITLIKKVFVVGAFEYLPGVDNKQVIRIQPTVLPN